MVVICLAVGFIGLANAGNCSSAQKVESGKDADQPVSQTAGKKTKPKPDLVINSIRLSNQCEIVIVIGNVGKGGVESSQLKATGLQVLINGSRKTIPVAAHDLQGKLRKPGGSAKVETGLKMSAPGLVEARVDSTNAVVESRENNNTGRVKLSPQCETENAAGTSGPGQMVNPITGLQGSRGKRSSADRAVGGKNADQQDQGSSSFVEVSSITLHQNRIVVLLERKGKEMIDQQAAHRMRLQIEAGKTRRMWPLVQIDPMFRKINGDRGELQFDTSIVLEKPTGVRVRVAGSGIEKTQTAFLKPTEGDTADKVVSSAGLSREDGEKREKQKPGIRQKGESGAKGDESDPTAVSDGMRFERPFPRSRHVSGSQISVKLIFTESSNVRPFKLSLSRNGSHVYSFPQSELSHPEPETKLIVRLPEKLTADDAYQFVATTFDGAFEARSAPFIIGPGETTETANQPDDSHGIRVSLSGLGDRARPGDSFDLHLQMISPGETLNIVPYGEQIFIHDRDQGFDQIGMWYMTACPTRVNRSEDGRQETRRCTLSNYIPVGDGYVLTFINSDGDTYGHSSVFSIVPEASDQGELNVLSNLGGSEHRFLDSEIAIRWEAHPAFGSQLPTRWRIEMQMELSPGSYGTAFAFSLESAATSEEIREGVIWHTFEGRWVPGANIRPGRYKIKIVGIDSDLEGVSRWPITLDHRSQGTSANTGSPGWNLSISDAYADIMTHQYVVVVSNPGGVVGMVDFVTEMSQALGSERWNRHEMRRRLSGSESEVVSLGNYETLVADPCTEDVLRITIDAGNEIDETNESDNVYRASRGGGINTRLGTITYGGEGLTSAGTIAWREDYPNSNTMYGDEMLYVRVRNCGRLPLDGTIRVIQQGTWAITGDGFLHPVEYHNLLRKSLSVSLAFGQTAVLMLYPGEVEDVNSELLVVLEGQIATFANENPRTFTMTVPGF